MERIKIKLSAFLKGTDDNFEPVYIDPQGLTRDDFLEQCGNFWDDVEEFANEREY